MEKISDTIEKVCAILERLQEEALKKDKLDLAISLRKANQELDNAWDMAREMEKD